MEDLLRELKISVFGKVEKEISEKSQQQIELTHIIDVLSNKLKIYQEKLQNYKECNTNTVNDTTKLEFYSERVSRENSHMNTEISITKQRIEEMKKETFEKDRDSRQFKYDTLKQEADISYLQQETRRINQEIIQLQNEKKNLKAAIIFVKKKSDELKDKVIKKDYVSKEFISEVDILLKRGKSFY
jgi:hypothetical protein